MAKAKFDIKTEATRPIYAYVGVTDRAVEVVRDFSRESVSDVQKRVSEIDFEPKALRDQAVTLVNARVEALTDRAAARRAAVEARVTELQNRVKELPERIQAVLRENEVTYSQLVLRGETLVERIRNQESTKAAVKSGKTATTKAKTTRTQAAKGASTTASTAKSSAKRAARTTSTTAKKQSTRPRSAAKATVTTTRKASTSAAKATVEGAKKVGD